MGSSQLTRHWVSNPLHGHRKVLSNNKAWKADQIHSLRLSKPHWHLCSFIVDIQIYCYKARRIADV